MSDTVAPKGPNRVNVRIVACQVHVPLVALFCGPIEGLLVHQLGGKKKAGCAGEQCPKPYHGTRTLWYGYAPGRWWRQLHGPWIPGVIEVTSGLELQLRGRDLVGEVWCLSRTDPSKPNSPVEGVFLERRDEPELLRPFDIRPPLFNLFGQPFLQLGTPNPMPPKLALPPVEASRPHLPIELAVPEEHQPTKEDMEEIRKRFPKWAQAFQAKNGSK